MRKDLRTELEVESRILDTISRRRLVEQNDNIGRLVEARILWKHLNELELLMPEQRSSHALRLIAAGAMVLCGLLLNNHLHIL
jgi:hypothetical protein